MSGAHRAGGDTLAWWPDTGFVPRRLEPPPPEAADSWLVDDGRVRGLEAHAARFARAATETGGEPEQARRLVVETAGLLARRPGRWFPRVEHHPGVGWTARMREAPPCGRSVVLAVNSGPDPRRRPRRKGPDLDRLARLRAAAAPADDVVLLDHAGHVVETATAGLAWWEESDGREVLVVPAPELGGLPAVTLGLLRRLAAESGVTVRAGRTTPERLRSTETWTLNALHGLRPVEGWTDGDVVVPAAPAPRAARWRGALDALAVRIPGPGALLG